MSQLSDHGAEIAADDWPSISAWNLAHMWDFPVRAMGGRSQRWPDCWAADAGSPSPFPNSATLLRPLAASEARRVTHQLAEFYCAGRGGPWLLWSAWPTPDLVEQGFQSLGHPPLMMRPAGGTLPPPPAELRIVAVEDDARMRDFEHVMAFGYPVPDLQAQDAPRPYDARTLGGPFSFWVGYVEDEPMAISTAYVDERAVGIYLVATMPQWRGKGYGAALTAHAMQAAPDLPVVLQASEDGFPVYQRLGFAVQGDYSLWLHARGA